MDKQSAHEKLKLQCKEFFTVLYKDHVNPVIYGRGSISPRVMLVSGWPTLADLSAGEAMSHEPHLGELLEIVGLKQEEVYLTSAVKTMAPGHRRPTLEQMELSRPYLFKQIELLAPKLIVALGETACRSLTGVAAVPVTDYIQARIADKNRIVYVISPLSYAGRQKLRTRWLEKATALGEYIKRSGI